MFFKSNSQFQSLSADKCRSSRISSNFKSTSIKLGLIKNWKFTYKSPPKFQEAIVNSYAPINFSKGHKKITYRRLPRFHQSIHANDPEKASKIIQSINCLRSSKARSVSLTTSRLSELSSSKNKECSFYQSQFKINDSNNQSTVADSRNNIEIMKMVQSHVKSVFTGQKEAIFIPNLSRINGPSLTDSRYFFSPKKI